jgi:histidinol phosphatase-like PHP family hydrolase
VATIPKCDFHIHTKYLGWANSTMDIQAILGECRRLGVTQLGITDHLNSIDKLPLHIPIKRSIESLIPDIDLFFGVELNFTGAGGEFAYSSEIKELFGFQFAIGGIHDAYLDVYDLKRLVDIQHRHHLKTCCDPLVSVLVHPYWFRKADFDKKGWPWFGSMKPVPESYARELGQTAKETGTAIEINAYANLEESYHGDRYVKEYIEFLSVVAEEGACFSLGSDAHDIGALRGIRAAWRVAAQLGLDAKRIWRPNCEPMRSGKTE